jgi:hypothetical protein
MKYESLYIHRDSFAIAGMIVFSEMHKKHKPGDCFCQLQLLSESLNSSARTGSDGEGAMASPLTPGELLPVGENEWS